MKRTLFIVMFIASGCAGRTGSVATSTRPQGDALAARIDSIIGAPPLHRTSWGISVVDLGNDRTLYGRNAEKLFIPASNMKLVVGATALAKLGVDYRYQTEVLAIERRGEHARSIVIVGAGDPTWSTRFHESATAPLDSIAAIVARAGIRTADELIIDVSRFDDELVHPAWEAGDLAFQYAPPVDAVGVNEGVFRFVVQAGMAHGLPAHGRYIGPVMQPVSLDVTTDTARTRRPIAIDFAARRDSVYISGRIPLGGADTSTLAITQPARTVAHLLGNSLRSAGVLVSGLRTVRDSADASALRAAGTRLGAHESPPMRDIAAAMLQPSQNWIAEQMHKTLGAHFGRGGSWRGGMDVERSFLYDVVRIDSGAVNIRDASGMAPQDLITPEAVIDLLRFARTQPWGDAFHDALAAPGLRGSTLSSRLRALDGRVFAKTGSISNVNSLSGYLHTADGRTLAFSILSNGSGLGSAPVRAAIDAIVLAIAEHSGSR